VSQAMTWLLPVAGDVAALRARIAALPAGDASPFAAIPGAHVGRLVVLDGLADPRGGPPSGPLLLVAVDADGTAAGATAAVAGRLGEVLAHCEGYPAAGDGADVDRWLRRHRVRDGFSLRPYPDATVEEVRRALDVRARLAAFAVQADGLTPAQLRAAFVEAFGR